MSSGHGRGRDTRIAEDFAGAGDEAAFGDELNAGQFAAVTAPDGPVLVIAAAGTGKTRTLTYRVAYLVQHGVAAERILLLTFTNRAAREMLERAERVAGGRVGGLWGGTFHHTANRMLRRHSRLVGYDENYSILDRDDARSLIRTCADELNLRGRHFPRPEVLMSLFSLAANSGRDVEVLAERRFGASRRVDVDDILRVHKLYTERKKSLGAMDFDDLLCRGLELFREHPEILNRYREHFVHILVDEYQDTNAVQSEWIDLLAAERRNLFVVGDDFQSIYSWRGAEYRNILSFPERYPDAKIFKLETNYRSVPEILEVANACIAGNPEQFQKELRAVREGFRPPLLARVPDGGAQARYVIESIRTLRAEGYRAGDIAVLYRAHYHALDLQLELAREGIPYVITSGTRFFEQAHIKDVCTLLRLFGNPGDELAFTRLLGLLPRVGRRTAVRIWKALGGRFDPADAEQRNKVGSLLPAAAAKDWETIAAVMAAAGAAGVEAGKLLDAFGAGFYHDYALENFEDYQRRLDDINEFIQYAEGFSSLHELLSEIALITSLEAEEDRYGEAAGESIRLSTIHQAKGLEWSVVILLWVVEGMFPSARTMDDLSAIAEERRLFYVAATRARDVLIMCMPALRRGRDGGVVPCMPSRFVQEIPAELLRVEDYHGAW